jgi:hypothetical protein
VLWPVVAQVVEMAALIPPGADINAIVAEQTCRLDILQIRPTCRAVKVRIHVETPSGNVEQQKQPEPDRHQGTDAERLREYPRIPGLPLARPNPKHPRRVDAINIESQRRRESETMGNHLRRHSSPENKDDSESNKAFPVRIKSELRLLKLGTDQCVAFS